MVKKNSNYTLRCGGFIEMDGERHEFDCGLRYQIDGQSIGEIGIELAKAAEIIKNALSKVNEAVDIQVDGDGSGEENPEPEEE